MNHQRTARDPKAIYLLITIRVTRTRKGTFYLFSHTHMQWQPRSLCSNNNKNTC